MRYIIRADNEPVGDAVDLTDAEDVADHLAATHEGTITAWDAREQCVVYTAPPGGVHPNRRGGARPGAGRKPLNGEPMRSVQVRLTDAQIALLRERGGGNLSAGVRSLLDPGNSSTGVSSTAVHSAAPQSD